MVMIYLIMFFVIKSIATSLLVTWTYQDIAWTNPPLACIFLIN